MSRQVYPITVAKNSAEYLGLIQLDALINAIKTMAPELDTATERSDEAATATLDLTADITLTDAEGIATRNTQTLTLQVDAATDSPDDEVHVYFESGNRHDPAQMIIRVVPNDGTNNDETPVDLTTAQLVTLINDGEVAEMNIVLHDTHAFRGMQTAAGGDTTALAHAGEGDGIVATFTGGVTSFETMVNTIVDLREAIGVDENDFKLP